MVDFDVDMDDIRCIKAGDNRRFNKVLGKYSVLIESVKRKYDADGYDDDDLAQIVRLSIWKAVIAFDEAKIEDHSKVPNQLTKLINKIVRRDIGSVFNLSGQKKRTRIEVEFDENAFPVENQYDNKVLVAELSRFLDGVKAKIVDLILQGYTQQEIAQKLGSSQPSIYRQIQAIKKVAFC